MAIAFVQGVSGAGTSDTRAVAFGSNNAAGNLIVVAVMWSDTAQTVTGVSDTRGNSYAFLTQVTGTNVAIQIWYAYNIAAGANTVTVTFSAVTVNGVIISEYSGLAAAGTPFDKQAGATGLAGTAGDSGSTSATTYADELLFGFCGMAATTSSPTAGAGYTLRTTNVRMITEDQVVASTGTYNATCSWTTARNWACTIATFTAPVNASVSAAVAAAAAGAGKPVTSGTAAIAGATAAATCAAVAPAPSGSANVVAVTATMVANRIQRIVSRRTR